LTSPSIAVRRQGVAAAQASLAQNRPLYPASMIKVPIAACALANDRLQENAPIVVSDADMTANDAASPLVPGYRATIRELVELMVTRSDNVATNALIDALGRDRATAYARRLRLRGTAVRRKLSGSLPLIDDPAATGRNTHPAGDSARLFSLVAERAIAGAETLHGVLHRQQWNEKLPRGLRPGDRFAHKTGDTEEVTHDGGILDTAEGERYVIVVYTAMPSSAEGDSRMAEFMSLLRPLL
jgi:beta-lactamase class A